jgi:hypothetical protein
MDRFGITLAVCFGLSALPVPALAQAPPASAVSDYHFVRDTGLLVFHVRADRAPDFEHVIDRIAAGLKTAASPLRQQQETGWRVFRSTDTPEGAIYVMMFDPAIPGADYDPVKMLTELAPAEVGPLYERLKAAVIRVERLDLERLR